MKLGGVLLLLGLLAGCGRQAEPIQPLQQVAAGAKMRIRYRPAPEPPPAEAGDHRESESRHDLWVARKTVVDQLRAAGYEVVEDGKWDVRMELSISAHRHRNNDPEFTEASAAFFDHKKRLVDRIAFAMKVGAAPTSEPVRVANAIVNGVVQSPKLSAYASERNERRAAKAKDAAASEPEPPEED